MNGDSYSPRLPVRPDWLLKSYYRSPFHTGCNLAMSCGQSKTFKI